MRCLTINFQSVQFNKDVIHDNDKIRVNVIAFPDSSKQTFVVEPRNLGNINQSLQFNITDQFKKLVFIFEKKDFFHLNPMIASKSINSEDVLSQKSDKKDIEVKTLDIYKPIRCQEDVSDCNSRIVGKVQAQFLVSERFCPKVNNCSHNIKKIHNGEEYSKVNSSSYDEFNSSDDDNLLLDSNLVNI